MKLLTKIIYLVKATKEPLFKRSRNVVKNDNNAIVDPVSSVQNHQNSCLNGGQQFQSHKKTNNSHLLANVVKEPSLDSTNKVMFSKKSQFSRQNQLQKDTQLINNSQNGNQSMNNIKQLLKITHLPMDLFNLHRLKYSQFTSDNYDHLFKKLSYACRNIDTLMKYQVKNKKQTSPLASSCPELESELKIENTSLFYSRQEMVKHEDWKFLILTLLNRLKKISNISELNLFLPTIITLKLNFGFIPIQIYSQIIKRNAEADFKNLTNIQISQIVLLIKQKNRTKRTEDYEQNQQQKQNINLQQFIQYLAQRIIRHPKLFTKDDFVNIFIIVNKRSKKMNILSQQLLQISENVAIDFLKDMSMENIYTYMEVYTLLHKNVKIKHLDTLKKSLQEKCLLEDRCNWLVNVLPKMQLRKLLLKNAKEENISEQYVKLSAEKLIENVAKVLSSKIFFLRPVEVVKFLDFCFANEIKEVQVLASISVKILEFANQLPLQTLGKSLFKLHLFKYPFAKLTQSICFEFSSRYSNQLKAHDSENIFSPPSGQSMQIDQALNLRQIHLHQCLIMVIWTLLEQSSQKTVEINKFTYFFKLFPPKLESMDPLAIQLTQNINSMLRDYSQIPKIQCSVVQSTFPEGRLKEFYRHQYSKSGIQLLMWEQAQFTGKFVANFNFKANKYLPERWSKILIYDTQDYIRFCQINQNRQINHNCYFDNETQLSNQFLQKRSHIIKKSRQNVSNQTRNKKSSQKRNQT